MKKLRKFGAAVILTSVLAMSAFAGQTETPPCPLPEPGQTETPPCGVAPGDMETPSSTGQGDLGAPTFANDDMSFSKVAADVLLNLLPLF